MSSYRDMAAAAVVTGGEVIPDQKPLFYFDFSALPGAPCSQMGEHADSPEEALEEVARRLEELDEGGVGLAAWNNHLDELKEDEDAAR